MTVALVPGVPALLPSYRSLDDPVAELRAACHSVVADLGPRMRVLASSGTAERVAAHLLASASAEAVESGDPTGVLVIGNGSAMRTDKAPGYFDARAAAFDDDLRRALVEPLPAALAGIDTALAEELWADVSAIRSLADLLAPGMRADVRYDDAPYGVQYWVVRWS